MAGADESNTLSDEAGRAMTLETLFSKRELALLTSLFRCAAAITGTVVRGT